MKKASSFEVIAARGWNVVNEGKTFTPVFVLGVFFLFHLSDWAHSDRWLDLVWSLLFMLPLFAITYVYDYPLHLRKFLWLPLLVAVIVFAPAPIGLYLLAIGLYFFFTVFFWGTFYYHLRIGTPWTNYRRFWKLVLKNSDSTSGNAQEQIPKFLMLLGMMEQFFAAGGAGYSNYSVWPYLLFIIFYAIYSYMLHYLLFTWKPAELPHTTPLQTKPKKPVDKVIIVIIDGCRKDRLAEADTPFLDWMKEEGTEFTQMETVYPDRTVVCFSSMFTGTYPREHGIQSNMVWKLGVRCESVFDSLRKADKTGRLLGIAHLIDSFGDDVESVTAIMKNDVADENIMKRARTIMEEQNPDFLVVQLIATDQTGHSQGALYDEYKQKIEEADRHTAVFYDWLKGKGFMENTVFIVAADHGQSDGIGGHGHLDEGERFVPFMMMGPNIKKGHRVHELHSLISITPTVCHLLEAPLPNKSRGPVLRDALDSQ
jgi:hypothetical protein